MENSQIKTKIRTFFLEEVLDGDAEGFDDDTPVLEIGLLDSLSMVGLLAFIDNQFSVSVPDEDVRPENFRSVTRIAGFVESLNPSGSRGDESSLDQLVRMARADGFVSHTAEFDDASVHYLELDGSGPTWVFLPALGNPSVAWADVAKPMCGDHRAILVDLAGFGRSRASHESPTLPDQAALVQRLLERDGRDSYVVVASSASSALGLRVARSLGDKTRAVVLTGYGLVEDPSAWWDDVRSLSTDIDTAVSRTYFRPPAMTTALRETLDEGLRQSAYDSFFDEASLATMADDFGNIDVPMLLVHGEEDGIVPIAAAELAASRAPRATIERIARCGHFPQSERPDEFALLVRNFATREVPA